MSLLFIILLPVPVLFVYMGWRAGLERERAKDLQNYLAILQADFRSYRNMYGPNPVTRIPETHGVISESVLLDVYGDNDPKDFFVVIYNWDTECWCMADTGNRLFLDDATAVWYRLPLKKYEKQRLSR